MSRTHKAPPGYVAVGYERRPGVDEEDYMDWVGNQIPAFRVSLAAGVFPTGLVVQTRGGKRFVVKGKRLVGIGG
jgi:hypothetical protein